MKNYWKIVGFFLPKNGLVIIIKHVGLACMYL